MASIRTYGDAPYRVVLLHGGPGAVGEMAPVARELSPAFGVLEPLMSAPSVGGQVGELRALLESRADLPVTLAGFSWGAWLALLFASAHPAMVQKLILIGSPPYHESEAAAIQPLRLSRLREDERAEALALLASLADRADTENGRALARLGALYRRADAYEPVADEPPLEEVNADTYERVWAEARALRRDGTLLRRAGELTCPVVAIHGDRDPHPAEAVRAALAATIGNFEFHLLERCGHAPWIERHARGPFFDLLALNLRDQDSPPR